MMTKFFSILFFLISVSVFSQAPYAELIHQEIYNISSPGQRNTIVGDFDKNGTIEVAFTTGNQINTFLKFLQAEGNGYREHRIETPANSPILWIDYDSIENKIYIAESRRLLSFDPITNSVEVIKDNFSRDINKFEIYTTDSMNYFVVRASSDLLLINQEGTILNQGNFGGFRDFAIGNVYDKSDKEIIVSQSSGSKILDLFSFQIKWEYSGVFGNNIYLSEPGQNGLSLIYGINYSNLTCFNVQAQSEMWTIEGSFQNRRFSYVPSSGNDNALILLSTNSAISARNPVTGNEIWQIPTSGSNNSSTLFHDLNGDGNRNLFYVSDNRLVVRDIESSTDWMSQVKSNRAFIALINKNDGDYINYVNCSGSSNTNNSGGLLEIRSGKSDSIIEGPILLDNFSTINDIAALHIDNDTYYLTREGSRKISVYKNTFTSVYASLDDFDFNLTSIQLIQLEENGDPCIIGINKNRTVVIFSITDGGINLIWESPQTDNVCKSYKIGNFYSDESIEVAILYNNAIILYDIKSNLLIKQIFVNYNQNHNAFDVVDLNQDGNYAFVIGGQNYANKTSIQLIDIEDEAIEEIDILDKSIALQVIYHENLDSTARPEMIVLGDKFYIYDTESYLILSEINAFPLEPHHTPINLTDIAVADLDLDKHKDILIAHQYGYARIRINEEFLNVTLPFIREYRPPSGKEKLATNTTISVIFSEEIEPSSLNGIEIISESGIIQSFTAELSSNQRTLLLDPSTNWTANENISILLPSTITDLAGNNLDGNRNGIYDGDEDEFTFTLNMGSGIDDIPPYFINLKTKSEIFPGQLISISGTATDVNDSVISDIKKILYSLNDASVISEGISVPGTDGKFDSSTEDFEINISSVALDLGTHAVYLATQDFAENWSEVDSISFTIIEESVDNWSVYGKDTYNTSYAPASRFNYPVSLKNSITHEVDVFDGLNRSIIVENKVIFTSNNRIWARDLETGELIWKNTYNNRQSLSTPCFAYGNIYLQIGDRSSSQIVCLSPTNGLTIWSTNYSVQKSDLPGILAADGSIIIVEGYSWTIISSYDAYNGNLNWTQDISTNNFDNWNPAIYDGKIYGHADNFGVIDLQTGELLKHITSDDLPYHWWGWSGIGNPVIDTVNNQIVLTNRQFMFALDLDTYEINWSISFTDYGLFNSTPALSGNSLFVGNSNLIMELSASDGELIWYNEDFNCNFDPVVSDSIVAFSSNNRTVVVDRKTKQVEGGFNKGGHLTLSGDYLIIAEHNGGQLYILEQGEKVPMAAEIMILDSIVCYGDNTASIEVIAEGGIGELEFNWEDSAINSNLRSSLPAGEYTVRVLDMFLNNVEQSITITEPPELILTTSSIEETNNESNGSATVIAEGGTRPYIYVWADFPGLSVPTINYLEAGNYFVEVIDANGCSAVTTVNVDGITSTNDLERYNIELRPTVSTGEFILQTPPDVTGSKYMIFNQLGILIKSGIIESEEILFNENLPPNLYIFTIISDTSRSSAKFIIKN
ncbi:MAG: hypothetical protein EA362_07565 [Saprospirales bacterium]|nr:MAG: hypothetical protein EA362_07565 [Saprospirales bacterium]